MLNEAHLEILDERRYAGPLTAGGKEPKEKR